MKQLGIENVSEFVRGSITLRNRLEQMKPVLQDPERFRQFVKDMESHLSEKDAFDWVKTISDTKLQGFGQVFSMEKERRDDIFKKNNIAT